MTERTIPGHVAATRHLRGLREDHDKQQAFAVVESSLKSAFDLAVQVGDANLRTQLIEHLTKARCDIQKIRPS
jgi:hypothetical protein